MEFDRGRRHGPTTDVRPRPHADEIAATNRAGQLAVADRVVVGSTAQDEAVLIDGKVGV
ncbi:hypothetical protein GCM10009624_23990 [Gordonia sinesedis]